MKYKLNKYINNKYNKYIIKLFEKNENVFDKRK